MKKVLALMMAAGMVLSMTACGGSDSASAGSTSTSTATSTDGTSAESVSAGIAGIAQCCDVGTLDDESFNQGCWEAIKAYGDENGIEYDYYLPAGEDATDEDRETLIRQAVADGADTIVCVGYLYGPALAWAAEEYPDLHFVAVDVTGADITSDGSVPANVFCITFKEEQAGYLAGYAAVKDGFTSLGFLGGTAVPAVIRYGYGFVQGADAAAQELGTQVQMNYYYGGQFYGDEKITAKMDGWYDGGTQIVFACGGGIWTSAAEAADKHEGKLIGVDVDQNYLGVEGVASGMYQANPFVTSAMKGLGAAVKTSLETINAGEWSTIAGSNENFGLEEGDYVGLPTDTDSWNFTAFTKDEYLTLLEKIRNGTIAVDNSSEDANKPTTSEYLTVDYQV